MMTPIEFESHVRPLQRRVALHLTVHGGEPLRDSEQGSQEVAELARRCSTGAQCVKTPDERVGVRGKPRGFHTQTHRSRDTSGERESASDSTLGVGGGRSVTLLDRDKESGAHNFPDHEHNESDTSAHHSSNTTRK